MAETTGGSGAGSGGGSAGGSQVEGLAINFSAPGAQETASATDKVAASVDTFGKVTVRSRLNLEELIACGARFTVQQLEELNAVNNSVQAVQNKTKADAEALRFAQARTEEGQRYLTQLEEMTRTFNMTTAELQRYKAEQLGVGQSAEASIAAMEAMTQATLKYGVVVKSLSGIDDARLEWEKQSAAQLAGQKAQALSDNAAAEKEAAAQLKGQRAQAIADQLVENKEAAAQLKGQRAQALADNLQAEKEAAAELKGQRAQALADQAAELKEAAAQLKGQKAQALADQAAAEKEAAAQLKGQRAQALADEAARLKEAAAELKGQRAQALADNARAERDAKAQELKEKEAALKRSLDLDIAYGEKSLKAQIDILQKIKAYQADARTDQTGTNLTGMFGPRALGEVDTLNEKVKQYNETLGHHGKRLEEVGEKTSLFSQLMGNNRIRTEGLVLAHEALQGRYTRLGGSLGVMTEYMSSAGIVTGVTSAIVLGAVAAVGGFIYELAKGSAELTAFNRANVLTAGYAGLTRDTVHDLAEELKGNAHGAIGTTTEMIVALGSSGKVSSEALRSVATTALQFQQLSGQSTEEVAKYFEKLGKTHGKVFNDMQNDIADWAAKSNDQYHYLSAAQYEHIRLLTLQGDKQAAVKELMDDFSESMSKQDKRVGILVNSYRGWVYMIQSLGEALKNLGKDWFNGDSTEETLNKEREKYERLVELRMKMAARKLPNGENQLSPESMATMDANVKAQLKKFHDAAIAYQNTLTNAKDNAELAQANSEGVEAARHLDYLEKMNRSQKQIADDMVQHAIEAADRYNYNEKLKWEKSYKGTKEGMEAAEKLAIEKGEIEQYSQEKLNFLIDEINKKHQDKVAAAKDDGRKQDLQAQLNADQAAYDLQIEANKHDIDRLKQLADQKQITRQKEYDGVTASYNDELQALQVMEAAKIATLEAYKPKSKADAEETKKRLQDVRLNYELTTKAIENQREKEQQAIVGKAVKEVEGEGKKEINSLNEKIKSQEKFNLEYGKTEAEKKKANALLDEEILKTMKLDLVKSNAIANDPGADPANRAAAAQHVKDLTVEIEKQQKLIEVTKEGRRIAEGADALKALNKYLDPASAKSFGDEFSGAFGKAGKSVATFITVLEKMRKEQAQNQDQQTNNAKAYINDAEDAATYEKNRATINERNTHQQLAGYSAMAASAASFFGEHSRGYQVLNTVSQAFHMAELAMNLASIAPAMAAGAAQFFAQSGWGGFAGVAAMGAVIAGFGIATSGSSGGGGMMSAKDRQAANGTGSVFGDDKAKSESISKSIKMVEENTYDGLSISSSMLVQLQSINAGINGLGTLLYRTDGFTTKTAETQKGFGNSLGTSKGLAVTAGGAVGMIAVMADKLLGGKLSQISGKIGNAIFGGNIHSLDTGITMGSQTVGQIGSNGVNINQYTDTKKDGGLFSKDKYNTTLASLGSQTNDQFTKIIQGMTNTIKIEAGMLGLNSDSFTAKLNSFVVSIGKISTKDMSAEDVQKALQNALSKVADDMANFSVEGLQKFQNAGEGAFETLTRIATEYETVDVVMQSFGRTFGMVGTGSLAARDNLVQLAGGMDKFTSQADYVLKNFYTDQEQAEALKKRLQPTLAKYNLSTEGANANIAFRDLIKSLDLTTTYGAEAYTELMQIAPAFKQITDANKDELDSLKAIADERKNLQDQLDDLTMTEMQKADKERKALNEANRGLYDQIQIAKKVKEAQDAAKNSLTSFISQMKSFATTAAGLNKNLIVGSLSNLTPEQQYAQARKQFEETRAKAYKGDSTAQGELSSVEQTFLQLSQKLNGGDAAYSSDLATVMRTNDDLSKWATNSTDIAQASLDALNNTSATLDDISKTLTLIAQGGQLTPDPTGPSNAPLVSMSGLNYANYGTVDMLPLVNEVKALRAELAGLRADQQVQTGDLINTSAGNAQVIVDGVKDALVDDAWSANNTVRTIK